VSQRGTKEEKKLNQEKDACDTIKMRTDEGISEKDASTATHRSLHTPASDSLSVKSISPTDRQTHRQTQTDRL